MADHLSIPLPQTAEITAIQSSSDHDLRVSCFCEENAWRLVYRHLHGHDCEINKEWDDYHVVFVSNERRCCPFFRQRARLDNPEDYVCWDYHVIVIRSKIDEQTKTVTKTEVLDIDTWLAYPCPLGEYLDGSFPHVDNPGLDAQYLPFFRVVTARNYLKYFYSDRMHMFKNGKWSSPPPEYRPIMNGLPFSVGSNEINAKSNLDMYINMSGETSAGSELEGK
ncbi:hypothetical protein ACHAXR_007883, partial [Thalassiosira sp. AJA248-18]